VVKPLARFAVGSGIALAVTVVFNALSFLRVWFAPGCADCVLAAGVPFPFVSHGGFFTETFVIWRGVRDNVAAVLVVASLSGLVSVRFMRS
jgi:hypothetical protein